jgi:hypothetical protein
MIAHACDDMPAGGNGKRPGFPSCLNEASILPVPSETGEMKRKQLVAGLATAVVAAGMWVQPAWSAVGITISVGDQPFYEGPVYWDVGYEWVWVPGFNRNGHWVHGHYQKRGNFHKEHANEHHQHHHHG